MEGDQDTIRTERVARAAQKLVQLAEAAAEQAEKDAASIAEEQSLQPYANCKTLTKLFCDACGFGSMPIVLGHGRTFYCSPKCFNEDWEKHQSRCTAVCNLYYLEIFRRATDLLQRLFYMYREVTFDQSIESIDCRPNTLIVTEGESHDEMTIKFPQARVDELAMPREQLLTLTSGKDVVSQFHPLCDMVLQACKIQNFDITKKIEEIEYIAQPDPIPWTLHRIEEGTISSQDMNRYVFKFTLENDTEWAIDLSGAQFGYPIRPLIAWQQYERERIAEIIRREPWAEFSALQARLFRQEIGDTVAERRVCGQFWGQMHIALSMGSCLGKILRANKLSMQELLCEMSKGDFDKNCDGLFKILRREFGLEEKD